MTSAAFRRDLIEKIVALGRRRPKPPRVPAYVRRTIDPATRKLGGAIQRVGKWRLPAPADQSAFNLRPFAPVLPRVLLIGASTGGPQALTKLIAPLDAITDSAPVLITQHMPATFTTIFAEHLSRASAKPVREAADGEPALAGTVYVAPGGRHMRVTRRDGNAVIVLDDGAPVHFCKPAVDPLFSSAAEVWGSWNLALILTGMGIDGTAGAADIVAGGGSVIAQDEATSVVWGMPGSAVDAGVCSAVLPLEQIGRRWSACSSERARDTARLPLPAQALEGPIRPRARRPTSTTWWRAGCCRVARKNGLFNLTGLVAKLKTPDAEPLIVEVVEAMTTERVAVLP